MTVTRIVHCTSVHPPFDTRIFWKECRTLASAGFDVVLIAPDAPSFEEGRIRLVAHPAPRSRLGRVVATPLRILRLAVSARGAAYHFHDPDLLPAAVLLRLLTRRPVVFDSHEDVPRQLLDRVWIPRPARRPAAAAAGWLESILVRGVSAVVSAEPIGARRFRHGEVRIVQNYPLLEEFAGCEAPLPERPPIVAYVGDLTAARGASQMVDAMGALPRDSDLRLVIAGNCRVPGLLNDLRRRPGWARVDYVGFQARPEVVRLLGRARVGLVVLQPTAQYREATQPVKLFEYMAAGVPVVASDFDSFRPFVAEVGSGLMVDPTAPTAIAGALARLGCAGEDAVGMGARGRDAVREHFSWAPEGERLVQLYRDLVRR